MGVYVDCNLPSLGSLEVIAGIAKVPLLGYGDGKMEITYEMFQRFPDSVNRRLLNSCVILLWRERAHPVRGKGLARLHQPNPLRIFFQPDLGG